MDVVPGHMKSRDRQCAGETRIARVGEQISRSADVTRIPGQTTTVREPILHYRTSSCFPRLLAYLPTYAIVQEEYEPVKRLALFPL